jgi:3-oxoacyl-(acyl-carrier-protein) synthase
MVLFCAARTSWVAGALESNPSASLGNAAQLILTGEANFIFRGGLKMESIEVFRKLRDVCDEVVKAMESEDEAAIENALGKFMLLMVKLDAIK